MNGPFPKAWTWTLRAALLIYAGALFTATHVPIPKRAAASAMHWDKPFHFCAYFVLAGLCILVTLRPRPWRFPAAALAAGLMAYAALDEYLQGFVGRTPDLYDWVGDSLGVAAAILLAQGVMMFLAWRTRCAESRRPQATLLSAAD